jgi:hypothetical protein
VALQYSNAQQYSGTEKIAHIAVEGSAGIRPTMIKLIEAAVHSKTRRLFDTLQ